MSSLPPLKYDDIMHKGNSKWRTKKAKDFFNQHAEGQQPKILFIACADSRVDPIEITDSSLGQLFVHRNVASLVVPDDASMKATVTYAVNHLNVEHVVICGHYGCGGVKAAMAIAEQKAGDLEEDIAEWVTPIVEVYQRHQAELAALADDNTRWQRLVELNVIRQIEAMRSLEPVKSKGSTLNVYGAIYQLEDGHLAKIESSEKAHVVNQIRRLELMATSYNPFKAYGALDKAKAINTALAKLDSSQAIVDALYEPTSELYKALNQKRVLNFSIDWQGLTQGLFSINEQSKSLQQVQEAIPMPATMSL